MADNKAKTGDGTDSVIEVPVAVERTAKTEHHDAYAVLRITVDMGDGADHCRPCADDIRVFDGDRRLALDEEDGVFVGNFGLDAALVDVVADPFTCESACRTFEPVADRTAIQVTRGCTTDLTVTYVPGHSAIQVTPRLEVLDDYGNCVEPARTVPGMRFRLFVGPHENGTALVRVTSAANPTVSFTDLPAREVTLVADPPARLGDQAIELRNSRNTTMLINLGAGQNLTLDDRFVFAPADGTVRVEVVEDADDRNRLADIPVRLTPVDGGAPLDTVVSRNNGGATFRNVPAGTYRVELAVDPVLVGGRTWTLDGPVPTVVVTADDRRGSTVLRLVEDRHVVQGTVYAPDGSAAAHALVEIRTAPDDDLPFETVLADAGGRYEWEAPHAGTFFVTTVQQDGHLRRVLPVSVNSVARLDIFTGNGSVGGTTGSTTSGGGGSGGGSTTEQDPTPFPLLVGNVDLTAGTAPRGRSGGEFGDTASAGATVSAAIRDVLGYQARTTDTKGFLTALQRSFTCEDKAGYTVCAWTPRSYAATIPADLGALTGAQASIFERAKVAADSIVPLLDGLDPLASDADRQDVDAIRSIVRTRITEIVAELSLEGGPRTQRVDELFERLTGELPGSAGTIVLIDVNTVGGELRVLGERFGMIRTEVNTIAEEEDFTNFLIIVDSVASLFVTWQQVRAFFDRSPVDDPTTEEDAPFLGTQLVLISRQLGVIAETVKETQFSMDSVFLGAAERQTVLLRLNDEGDVPTTMLLSELLDWVDRFATDEGPGLIQDAGTDGVNAFVPTIRRLATLVASAPEQDPADPQIPPSFFTARVLLALRQLASQLARATDLADAVFERLGLPDRTPSATQFRTRRGGRR